MSLFTQDIESLSRIYLNMVLNEAGGQEAGKLELVRTSLAQAKAYAEELFTKNGRELYTEIPDFDKNYQATQAKAKMGTTQRKEMPVISTENVKELQQRLKDGHIDVSKPFSSDTNSNNPFPEGLSGQMAKDWLENGLKDGDKKDDVVNASMKKFTVSDLIPIQQQVYFDKSISAIAEFGAVNSRKFFEGKTTFIASSDKRIIDGHHRFLGAMLLDPSMKVTCLVIDLPINKLLPMSLAYGDAIGNKRNA